MKTTKALLGILIITMALLAEALAQDQFTNGLVAYYPFNGNANDESGNGHTGVVYGATMTVDRLGRAAKAYSFNGPSNYITAVISNLPAGNSPRTITGWVRPAQTGKTLSVIGYGQNNGNGQFGLSGGGGPGPMYNLGLWKGLTGWPPPFKMPVNTWSFIAATCSNQAVTVWLNNSHTNWTGCDQYGCIDTSNNQKLFVGATSADGQTPSVPSGVSESEAWYTGAIDDVRVYNRALSVSEVQQLYDYESGPRVNLIKAVKPSFSNLTLTTNYQLQLSGDLNTWTNQGAAFTATNTSMVYPQYFDVDNWGKLFFRLQVTP